MDIRRQNFISVDKKSARNSYGDFFTIDERVGHQDHEVGTAKILGFEVDSSVNEVVVTTDEGTAHLDFLTKL
jgi:hypothetical protein